MAAITTKFLHYASPLLLAFHLPKGHLPISSLTTELPTFLPPFLHQNPTFNHFPSMASYVVRQPHPCGEGRHKHNSRLVRFHTSSSTAAAVAADFPPKRSDSPLMQMWRDLQVEARLCPTPHTRVEAMPPALAEKDFSVGSNTAETFCDWEEAAATLSSEACLSPAESEITRRRKVEDNLRMQGLRISSLKASFSDDFKLSAAKEIKDDAPAAALLHLPAPSQMPSPTLDIAKKALLESGRWEMKDFLLKLENLSVSSRDDIKELEELIRSILKEMRKWPGSSTSQAAGHGSNNDDDDDGDDNDDDKHNNNNNDDDWF